MSQSQATIVNLAASHVSVSVFGTSSGSLVLQRFHVEELTPGLTVDDQWLDAAVNALRDLVEAHGISGYVTVIVPGFLLLQKSLKVPQVESQKQAQIVAYEAQNAIPYPLNEVIWDSQVMSSDGVEAEVLLFALRTEVASRIANLVSSTGLRPYAIQASPLLDSQAFLLAGGSATEEVLILNVGARSTTLSFVGPGGANIQSANIGGNLLTQGLSDNTGQPFAAAEALKVGYFSGVLHLAESDPQAALLQFNSQQFIRRLSQDINRRLINVRRGAGARQPTRILLTGRGALLPGLKEQLCETLRLPVEPFQPASVLILGEEVSQDLVRRAQNQVSEVVGEAARLLLPQAAGVNLIPKDIAAQIAFSARQPKLLTAALLAALIPFPVWYVYSESAAHSQDLTSKLAANSAELKRHQVALIDARQKTDVVLAVNRELESVVLNRPNWLAFLADLQVRISSLPNTWVEEMHVRRETQTLPPAAEGEPPPPPVTVSKVILTVRFLLPEVAPQKAHNAVAMNKRQKALLEALRQSKFIAEIPDHDIKGEFTPTNSPKLTLTLVINKEAAL
ncbi:MAG: pilus assembly protein PilM [Verrucomicrobiota bacterium]